MSLKEDIIHNMEHTMCLHNQKDNSSLFQVMKYYDEIVLPTCPTKDGCTCLINYMVKVTIQEQHYTVHVNCAGQDLQYFPKLPTHTQAVDLSDNKLNDTAFEYLNVTDQNYNEIENLTLDRNKLENFPDKLLKMNKLLILSAKSNKMTSVSFLDPNTKQFD